MWVAYGRFPLSTRSAFLLHSFFFLVLLVVPLFLFLLKCATNKLQWKLYFNIFTNIRTHTPFTHTKKKDREERNCFSFLSTAYFFLSLAYSSRSTYTKGNQTTLQAHPHTQTKSAFSLWFTALLFETPPLHSVFYLLICEWPLNSLASRVSLQHIFFRRLFSPFPARYFDFNFLSSLKRVLRKACSFATT